MTDTITPEAAPPSRSGAQTRAAAFGANLNAASRDATRSLFERARVGLYPAGAMVALHVAGTGLHDNGAQPMQVLIGTGAAVLVGVASSKVRTWLRTERWRSVWAGGCLGAATVWAAAATEFGTSMASSYLPSALTVGGSLLAVPWWWMHRDSIAEAEEPMVEAEQLQLTAPDPLPAIEAPPAPHEHQLAWEGHVGAKGHLLPGSFLADPEEIFDHEGEFNGTAWTIDGGVQRHTYPAMHAALDEMKATLDRPDVDSKIYIERDREGYKTRGRIIVLERNPLDRLIEWTGPTLDQATGLVPLAVYPDGSGWAQYSLYKPGWGTPHDLWAGVSGSGKSTGIRVAIGESMLYGSAVKLFDPHGGASFLEIVPHCTGAYLNAGEIYAGAMGFKEALAERLTMVEEVGVDRFGPDFGHPILHSIWDEASNKAILKSDPVRAAILAGVQEGRKVWMKVSVLLQRPSGSAFDDDTDVREQLLGGNVIAYRVASVQTTRMLNAAGLEIAPHELPHYFDPMTMQRPTTGLGYVINGGGRTLVSRTAYMSPTAFTQHVTGRNKLDDRTAEAWQRGYENGIRDLERLAEEAEKGGDREEKGGDREEKGGGGSNVTPLRAGRGNPPGARDELIALFQQKGRLTMDDIRAAGICSPSRAFDLLADLKTNRLIEQEGRGVYIWAA
ncbi:hypothetical protein AB0395_21995 [Streptosporangium sp. NPDC051023]|uniref:hypothetical protein n=1 Tax=Streptosporangium sp. NPDC051023 TaxID=3155410 RepID=UPI00344C93E0